MRTIRTLAICLVLSSAAYADDADVNRAAEKYLNAMNGKGDESGKDLLFGGVSMDAQIFSLENWKIVSRDWVKKEKGDLGTAQKLMSDLDADPTTGVDLGAGREQQTAGARGHGSADPAHGAKRAPNRCCSHRPTPIPVLAA